MFIMNMKNMKAFVAHFALGATPVWMGFAFEDAARGDAIGAGILAGLATFGMMVFIAIRTS